ncbi:MAG: ion transporter [Treponema sp.]|nr:ion transporter [Treponema sp.]
MKNKIKQRVFEIIQDAKPGDKLSRIFDITLISLIIVNVCLVIADTFALPEKVSSVFYYVETFSVIIFTIEYILRVWTADLLFPKNKYPVAILKYIFSFLAIIDFLAIIPFYLPFIIPIDLRVLRMLRIIRLFRIFKINRYTDALSNIFKVFKEKKHELLSSIFVVLLLMIVAAVLMFNIENAAQPEVFKNAFDALWWALATLTTVGYGDIYPVTPLGKLLSAVIALLGIGLVAVPTGIISAGFVEEISESKECKKIKYCPYCGEKLDI